MRPEKDEVEVKVEATVFNVSCDIYQCHITYQMSF